MMKFNLLCFFGIHSFVHSIEYTKCTVLKHITELHVPVKECTRCGIRYAHLMPKGNGVADKWRIYPYKKDDTIHFKKL